MVVDFVPWRVEYTKTRGIGKVVLHKAYPVEVLEKDNIVTRYHHKLHIFSTVMGCATQASKLPRCQCVSS